MYIHSQSPSQEVGVASEQEEGVATTMDACIRCTALARIVHGDAHWVLAKTHIQLAAAYLELRGISYRASTMATLTGCSSRLGNVNLSLCDALTHLQHNEERLVTTPCYTMLHHATPCYGVAD